MEGMESFWRKALGKAIKINLGRRKKVGDTGFEPVTPTLSR